MSEVVIVITAFKNEWDTSWGLDNKKEEHKVGDINGFSEGTELIVVNGKPVNPDSFADLYNKLEHTTKYIVYHGNKDSYSKLDKNTISGTPLFYSSLERGDNRKMIWSKVIEPLANAVRAGKSKLFEDRFDWLLQLCQGKTTIDKVPRSWISTINKVLRSFLPLDIDMQALADEKVDKEKYLQEMAKDLDALYSSAEKKKTHYRRKLYDLWYLLGQKEWFAQSGLEYSPELEDFTPIEKPKPALCEFAGINSGKPNLLFPIHKFLESLDTGDIQTKDNNITTFHEWYIKLCEYLKEHEVYRFYRN